MRVAVRKHHDVAGEQLHRRPAGNAGPATALRDRVVLDHVLDAAHQQRRELLRRRRLGGPVAAAADVEEHGAAQAHAAQDIRQRVLAHLDGHRGVSIKSRGRSIKLVDRAHNNDGRAGKRRGRGVKRRIGQSKRMGPLVAIESRRVVLQCVHVWSTHMQFADLTLRWTRTSGKCASPTSTPSRRRSAAACSAPPMRPTTKRARSGTAASIAVRR